jgi:ABC-type phosphate transport system auxiliary subunit
MSENNENVTRPMIERLFERINQLEGNLAAKIDSKLDALRSHFDAKIDSKIDGLRSDMDAKFDQLRFDMDAKFMGIRDDLSIIADDWRQLRADQKHLFRRIQNLEKTT